MKQAFYKLLILFLYSALVGLMTLWIFGRVVFESTFMRTLIVRVIALSEFTASIVWLLFTGFATLGSYIGLYGIKSRFSWINITVSPRDKLRRSQKLMNFIPWVNYILNTLCFAFINGPIISSFEKYFKTGKYGLYGISRYPVSVIV